MPNQPSVIPDDASQLRVLVLAPRSCQPPNTGAKLRNYHLTKQLAKRAQVTFLGFKEENPRPMGGFAPVCEQVVEIPGPARYRALDLVKGLIGPVPVTVRNYTTDTMSVHLKRLLDGDSFHSIQIEALQMTGYVPLIRGLHKSPALLLDWHNVESELMRRYSEQESNLLRRLYARVTARHLENSEKRTLNDLDGHISVSSRDREQMLSWAPDVTIRVIENGVDVNWYSDEMLKAASPQSSERRRLLFVGSMDYHANVDAVVWFVREIWPGIHRSLPGVVFTIVGRNPAPAVRYLAAESGVEVTGTVDDVRPYYSEALALVVPLRSGGGSRLKILESMAAGVPVISTSLGAEGIDITPSRNIILADNGGELIDATVSLCQDPVKRTQIIAGGRHLVQARYDWPILGDALFRLHYEIVERRAKAAASV